MKTTLLACAAAVAIVAACSTPEPKAAADTIYTGGDIVTMHDKAPSAQALAVKDSRILAVGDRKTVEAGHKGAKTKVVNLAGKTLLPGFIDAHSHPASSGLQHLRSVDCDLRSVQAIQQAIRERAPERPEQEHREPLRRHHRAHRAVAAAEVEGDDALHHRRHEEGQEREEGADPEDPEVAQAKCGEGSRH